MVMVILPRDGIGPVKLGMSRARVRTELAMPAQTFFRYGSDIEADYFVALGIQVDYDKDGICNFITALAGAKPTFRGRAIVGMPFEGCRKWYELLDSDLEVDEAGLVSRKLGISVYAPGAMKAPSDPVESVSVFAEGYYD